MTPVQPVATPAPYLGGKRSLAKRIVSLINSTPHSVYAEPFVGMGGVFFRRTLAPKTEVINDFNGEVANLFRILQRHYPQFMDTLRYQIASRREFERLRASDPKTLTDLERAGRFLYLQRLAFGGKVTGQTFGVSNDRGSRFDLTRIGPALADIHERMAGVTVESLPWAAFVDRYDRAETLFYIDPPYWGGEADYGTGMFGREDFSRMAARLAELKGHFILSINDRPETREIFGAFKAEEVSLNYSVSATVAKPARELLVRG